ncbi:hypothetical protein [Sphingomonas sp.]|uniref:hypothetical protein n=1 Tax=Sphingomonas sp. TaxID=28214 RepID=UPI0035C86827
MATYFAGSTLDALVPSLSGCGDTAATVWTDGGYAEAYVTDPIDGVQKGVTRVWSHMTVVGEAYQAPSNGLRLLTWFNEAGAEVVRLQAAGGYSKQLAFFNTKTSQWVNVGGTGECSNGTYDVLIVVHPTAGRLAWFFNGNLAVDVRGLDTSSIGNVAKMRLGRVQDWSGKSTFSNVLMASYNTIGHTVRRRAPSANGSVMQWAGGYGDVDDGPVDDSDAISASNVGEVARFVGPVFTPTSTGNVIKAVAVAARIRNDGDVVPTNARALLAIGGTEYQAPKNMPIRAGFAGSVTVFDVDPSTGAPWSSIANVNGEFGLKAIE